MYFSEERGLCNIDFLMSENCKKLLYPQGSSFSVHCGGRLENLRENCTLKEIRKYHQKYYHLNNLVCLFLKLLNFTEQFQFIIVCGNVCEQQLLNLIGKIEDKYIKRTPKDFQRPFQQILPELQSKYAEIFYPDDNLDYGKNKGKFKNNHLFKLIQKEKLI